MSNIKTISLTILLIITVCGVLWIYVKNPIESSPHSQQAVESVSAPCNEATQTCTNPMYKFTLSYPKEWHAAPSNLSSADFWTFYNYNEADAAGKSIFSAGQNKIEVRVGAHVLSNSSSDYPSQTETAKKTVIAGQPAREIRTVFSEQSEMKTYEIQLPGDVGKYLILTIYGDPANFESLDDVAQSIDWI